MKTVTYKGREWTVEKIKQSIQKSDRSVFAALMIVYGNQTRDEQNVGHTKHENGIGFNGVDSDFLSSLAEQYKLRQSLSPNQIKAARKCLVKYAKQIFNEYARRIHETQIA